jgi:hypothetical protein
MHENEKSKVIELTEKAIVINEKLLIDEKTFVDDASKSFDIEDLKEKNENLKNLARKENLYLDVAQSLLKKISREDGKKD